MPRAPNWSRIFEAGARLAETITAGSALRRDWELMRAAGTNVLLATEFPIGNAIPRWTSGGNVLERIERLLAEPAVRAWLVAWAEMPRPTRARPKMERVQ